MENKIIVIETVRLHAHPKNPRKNIGDVTELAESIKESGILQNLTVVPWVSELTGETCEGEYTVIIGHRRLAAAKAAGIKELPCAIKEMTPAQQLATMLAENVQRNDLTPIEQAEGIQMMFDIGESIADVVAKTGLSESTVRRRTKMLELDREKLRATEGRGATLADYEKLNEIEDIEVRNSVLESIGTNNFNMQLKTALNEQISKRNKKLMLAELDKFAKKCKQPPAGYVYEAMYNYNSFDNGFAPPKDAEQGKYAYIEYNWGIYLYKKTNKVKKEETAEDKAKRAAEEKETERTAKLKELAKRAYELRRKFIEEFNPAPRHGKEIKRFLWNMLVFGYTYITKGEINALCGTSFETDDGYEKKTSMADEYFDAQPEKAMLQIAYLMSEDKEGRYINYNGKYCKEEVTDKLYECLERLGYQISDEEKKLMDGTHELFSNS